MKGGRDAGCTDEPTQRSRQTNTDVPSSVSHDDGSRLLGVRTLLRSKPRAVGPSFSESPICPSLDIPPLARSRSNGSASSLSQPLAPCERLLTPAARLPWNPSDVAVVGNAHATTGYVPHPAVSSFTVLPSIHFRTIPRSLRIPLSLIPPERVQISSIAGGDLDMTLYVHFWPLNFHQVARTEP